MTAPKEAPQPEKTDQQQQQESTPVRPATVAERIVTILREKYDSEKDQE